jgi:ABC-type arginine/histidine transport system permease subunit
MTKPRLMAYIALTITFTLSTVVVAMTVAMMFGLFNEKVSNEEIFKILAPTFSGIIGGFIGLLSGYKLGTTSND